MLSFGDPRPFAELVRWSDAVLIIQVTDLAEARRVQARGADRHPVPDDGAPAAELVGVLAAQAEDALGQALGR